MKKNQYLLLKLMEECAEISHIASKQIQFGKDSDNNGKYEKTNRIRIKEELLDLLVVVRALQLEDQIPGWSHKEFVEAQKAKMEKMQKYLNASAKLGMMPEIKL
jgi:NTP pyrophosphatase (non-canonical NTP hydrolase)